MSRRQTLPPESEAKTVVNREKRDGARPYVTPRLVAYGDLRTLTLGGSPGMGDSGGSVLTRNPLS